MRFIYFFFSVIYYVLFEWHITYNKGFWTWIWLGFSIFFAIRTYISYKNFNDKQ